MTKIPPEWAQGTIVYIYKNKWGGVNVEIPDQSF